MKSHTRAAKINHLSGSTMGRRNYPQAILESTFAAPNFSIFILGIIILPFVLLHLGVCLLQDKFSIERGI